MLFAAGSRSIPAGLKSGNLREPSGLMWIRTAEKEEQSPWRSNLPLTCSWLMNGMAVAKRNEGYYE